MSNFTTGEKSFNRDKISGIGVDRFVYKQNI